jgi:hypothetical protein
MIILHCCGINMICIFSNCRLVGHLALACDPSIALLCDQHDLLCWTGFGVSYLLQCTGFCLWFYIIILAPPAINVISNICNCYVVDHLALSCDHTTDIYCISILFCSWSLSTVLPSHYRHVIWYCAPGTNFSFQVIILYCCVINVICIICDC